MEKFLWVKFDEQSEFTPIDNDELAAVRPVVNEMLKLPVGVLDDVEPFALFGHIEGYDEFMKFAPDGEESLKRITDIRVLQLSEILM